MALYTCLYTLMFIGFATMYEISTTETTTTTTTTTTSYATLKTLRTHSNNTNTNNNNNNNNYYDNLHNYETQTQSHRSRRRRSKYEQQQQQQQNYQLKLPAAAVDNAHNYSNNNENNNAVAAKNNINLTMMPQHVDNFVNTNNNVENTRTTRAAASVAAASAAAALNNEDGFAKSSHENNGNIAIDDVVTDDNFDEARYNLATRVMSNGVEVIIASDKTKTIDNNKFFNNNNNNNNNNDNYNNIINVNQINNKNSLEFDQNSPTLLRIVPSHVYKPTTLAASTLKNQMILLMPSNVQEDFAIPIDSNQFITKTCLTTYTYRTTYLQDGKTTVESREKVISNIATEERNYPKISPLISLGVTLTHTPELAIGVFPTTYSYYNTILEGEQPIVVTTAHTIINTITGPEDYIAFLQPSEEATPVLDTKTYYSEITLTKTVRQKQHDKNNTQDHSDNYVSDNVAAVDDDDNNAEDETEKCITSTKLLTQVIVTESLPAHAASTSVLTSYYAYDDDDDVDVKNVATTLSKHNTITPTKLYETQHITYTYLHTYTDASGNERIATSLRTTQRIITKNLILKTRAKTKTTTLATTLLPTTLSNIDFDMHIYATKTYLTTFTYYTTTSLFPNNSSIANAEQAAAAALIPAITTAEMPTTIVNYHTRIIENVITDSVPSNALKAGEVSKFHAALNKKGKNQRRVIVTMATLLSGQTLEITAMQMLKPTPATTISTVATAAAPPVIIANNSKNPTPTKIAATNSSTLSQHTHHKSKQPIQHQQQQQQHKVKSTENAATKFKQTQSQQHKKKQKPSQAVLHIVAADNNNNAADAADFVADYDDVDDDIAAAGNVDELSTGSVQSAVYVAAPAKANTPTAAQLKNKTATLTTTTTTNTTATTTATTTSANKFSNKKPQLNNKNVAAATKLKVAENTAPTPTTTGIAVETQLPVPMDQLIGSLNLKRLTALRPVFNAMADLIQNNFVSVAVGNNKQQHKPVVIESKNTLKNISAHNYYDSMSTNTPIYIPVRNAATAAASKKKKKYATILETKDIYNNHAVAEPIDNTVIASNGGADNAVAAAAHQTDDDDDYYNVDDASDDNDENVALNPAHLSAHSLHIQPPLLADVTINDDSNWLLDTANKIYPSLSQQQQQQPQQPQQQPIPLPLINGGIQIRPGEVITANSDVIIGKPNGIQFPRLPQVTQHQQQQQLQLQQQRPIIPLSQQAEQLNRIQSQKQQAATPAATTSYGNYYKHILKQPLTMHTYVAAAAPPPTSYASHQNIFNNQNIIPIGMSQQHQQEQQQQQQQQRQPQQQQQSQTYTNTVDLLDTQAHVAQHFQQLATTTKDQVNYDAILRPPPPLAINNYELVQQHQQQQQQQGQQTLNPMLSPPPPPPTTSPAFQAIPLRQPEQQQQQYIPSYLLPANLKQQQTLSLPTYYADKQQESAAAATTHLNYALKSNEILEIKRIPEIFSTDLPPVLAPTTTTTTTLMTNTILPAAVKHQSYNYYQTFPQTAENFYEMEKFKTHSLQQQKEPPPIKFSVTAITAAAAAVHPQKHFINLDTHVLKTDIDVNVPPLTFKKDEEEHDYPHDSAAIHGQIMAATGAAAEAAIMADGGGVSSSSNNNVVGSKLMPHIKIPLNEQQVQVNLTPQNVIGILNDNTKQLESQQQQQQQQKYQQPQQEKQYYTQYMNAYKTNAGATAYGAFAVDNINVNNNNIANRQQQQQQQQQYQQHKPNLIYSNEFHRILRPPINRNETILGALNHQYLHKQHQNQQQLHQLQFRLQQQQQQQFHSNQHQQFNEMKKPNTNNNETYKIHEQQQEHWQKTTKTNVYPKHTHNNNSNINNNNDNNNNNLYTLQNYADNNNDTDADADADADTDDADYDTLQYVAEHDDQKVASTTNNFHVPLKKQQSQPQQQQHKDKYSNYLNYMQQHVANVSQNAAHNKNADSRHKQQQQQHQQQYPDAQQQNELILQPYLTLKAANDINAMQQYITTTTPATPSAATTTTSTNKTTKTSISMQGIPFMLGKHPLNETQQQHQHQIQKPYRQQQNVFIAAGEGFKPAATYKNKPNHPTQFLAGNGGFEQKQPAKTAATTPTITTNFIDNVAITNNYNSNSNNMGTINDSQHTNVAANTTVAAAAAATTTAIVDDDELFQSHETSNPHNKDALLLLASPATTAVAAQAPAPAVQIPIPATTLLQYYYTPAADIQPPPIPIPTTAPAIESNYAATLTTTLGTTSAGTSMQLSPEFKAKTESVLGLNPPPLPPTHQISSNFMPATTSAVGSSLIVPAKQPATALTSQTVTKVPPPYKTINFPVDGSSNSQTTAIKQQHSAATLVEQDETLGLLPPPLAPMTTATTKTQLKLYRPNYSGAAFNTNDNINNNNNNQQYQHFNIDNEKHLLTTPSMNKSTIITSTPFAVSTSIKFNTTKVQQTTATTMMTRQPIYKQQYNQQQQQSNSMFLEPSEIYVQQQRQQQQQQQQQQQLSNTENLPNIPATKLSESFNFNTTYAHKPQQQLHEHEHEQEQHHHIILPTKYITNTKLLTVTTIKTTISTIAGELKTKILLLTRTRTQTQTATINDRITATETETETETKIKTKTKTSISTAIEIQTHTLVLQPTRITDTHYIVATTTATETTTTTLITSQAAAAATTIFTTATPVTIDIDANNTELYHNHIAAYQQHENDADHHREHQQPLDNIFNNNNKNNNNNNKANDTIINQAAANNNDSDSILIVMTHSNNRNYKYKLTTSTAATTTKPVGEHADNTGYVLDYDLNIKFDDDGDVAARDEQEHIESSNTNLAKDNHHILLGGIVANTAVTGDNDVATAAVGGGAYAYGVDSLSGTAKCQPLCKTTRNELCALLADDGRARCICRPGFARMFPDRPCKQTYTYTMRIQLHRVGNYQIDYEPQLANNATSDFHNLATISHDSIDRMIMQSDFRDIYHGIQMISFEPQLANNKQQQNVMANFLLQLSDNTDEKRLENVFKKYLRLSNYSIGGTELFTSKQGVEALAIVDFDECAHSKLHDCSKNAHCFNLQGTYTCSCQPGYADLSENIIYPGRICSAEIIGCEKCHYHGKCVAAAAAASTPASTLRNSAAQITANSVCECFAWYTGATCQLNLKILLISLIAIGTMLFILLLFCILLTWTKNKHQQQHQHHHHQQHHQTQHAAALANTIAGIQKLTKSKNKRSAGLIGRSVGAVRSSSNRSINADKRAMIKDSSSESSQNSLTYVLKKELLVAGTQKLSGGSNAGKFKRNSNSSHGMTNEQQHHELGYDALLSNKSTATTAAAAAAAAPPPALLSTSSFTHSFAVLGKNYSEQSDRSLTVMIPRAKYHHPSVLPQTQLMHHQLTMERVDKHAVSGVAKHEQYYADEQQIPNNTNASNVALNNDILQTPAKIPAKKVSSSHTKNNGGALVSAGFEVSAVVGGNLLSSTTTTTSIALDTSPANALSSVADIVDNSCNNSLDAAINSNSTTQTPNSSTGVALSAAVTTGSDGTRQHQYHHNYQQLGQQQHHHHHHSNNQIMTNLINAKLNFSECPESETNTYKCDEDLIDTMDVWLDNIQKNELAAEARSFDETTVQAATKSLRIYFDNQTTHTNDEANTMAERDIGSTFLLPHTHLYKPERQESDISGFDSF